MECDCDDVFNGPCVDPESDEALQHAKNEIKKSKTYQALPKLHALLLMMHACFCTMATCGGIPALQDIHDEIHTNKNDCVYCCEGLWALRGFKFGFYVFPCFGQKPPPNIIPNYANKHPEMDDHIGADLKKEYKKGWLRLVTFTRYTTPLFVKTEATKFRKPTRHVCACNFDGER